MSWKGDLVDFLMDGGCEWPLSQEEFEVLVSEYEEIAREDEDITRSMSALVIKPDAPATDAAIGGAAPLSLEKALLIDELPCGKKHDDCPVARSKEERSMTGRAGRYTAVYCVVGDPAAVPLNIKLVEKFRFTNEAIKFAVKEFDLDVSRYKNGLPNVAFYYDCRGQFAEHHFMFPERGNTCGGAVVRKPTGTYRTLVFRMEPHAKFPWHRFLLDGVKQTCFCGDCVKV